MVRDITKTLFPKKLLGILPNPPGYIADFGLDKLGVGEDKLPHADEEWQSAGAALGIHGNAYGGLEVADGGVSGALKAAGVAKVTTHGKNRGDLAFTTGFTGDASGKLTASLLGANLNGDVNLSATVTLDAQDGYRPDKLVLTGVAGYSGSGSLNFDGTSLKDVAKAFKRLSASSSAGAGKEIRFTGELDLHDPANRKATFAAIAGAATPATIAPAGALLAQRLDQAGTLKVAKLDSTESPRAESPSAPAWVAVPVGAPRATPKVSPGA